MGGVSETIDRVLTVFLDLEKLPTWDKDWRERDSRPKHITAWIKNAAEKFRMRLRSSASVRLRLRLRACICAQKIKRLDTSRRKKSLHPDASIVQGLSGCTIVLSRD